MKTTDQKVEVQFHDQDSHQIAVKNAKEWQKSRVKRLVQHSHGPGYKARQIACQHGLLASMEDAFNKVPVRARA